MKTETKIDSQRFFYYFKKISEIPRGSGDTGKISGFLMGFAEKQGLWARRDEADNVVIRKPGTSGYETAPGVILQAHTDMICEKKPGVSHDFHNQGLQLKREGDYLYAEGTTLGGDDGIGVAYILAVLESSEIPHPPLEAVFTADEEIGMLGAGALDMSLLRGRILINLDSEEEGHFLCGCAGGLTASCTLPVRFAEVSGKWFQVKITGLKGGHSGNDIDKYRANSDMLAGRLLYALGREMDFALSELTGGTKDNAIPRETRLLFAIDGGEEAHLKEILGKLQEELRTEYRGIEEEIRIEISEAGAGTGPALHSSSLQKVIFFLMQMPGGVEKMSGELEGLVETSCNLGILELGPQALYASLSVRSALESGKRALADRICYLTEFLGGEYQASGTYPAWEYQGESSLRKLMEEVWEKMYGTRPKIDVIHAGVECGLFYKGLEGLDCVSIGPDLFNIHTTEEKLSVSSAERVYEFLLKVLEKIKE